MNEQSESPSITEHPETARPTENHKPPQEAFTSRIEKSTWQKLKNMKTNIAGGITLALYLDSGNITEAKKYEYAPQPSDNKPVAEQIEPQEFFKDMIQKMDRLYMAGFENSRTSTQAVFTILEKIHKSPEFGKLDKKAQAEILHRQCLSKLTYNKLWFAREYKKFSLEQAQNLWANYTEINSLCKQSINKEGEISLERQRTINALIESSKAMTQQSIQLEVERPDLAVIADHIKKESYSPLEFVMSNDPHTRYVGDGLFIFPDEEHDKTVAGIVGLAKFAGDLPSKTTLEQGVKKIGGAHYNMKTAVIPWVEAVRKGKVPSTPSEKAFIGNMERLGMLEPDKVKDLILTPLDPIVFTHEIAHQVELNNPGYLQKAKDEYRRLPQSDRALFEAFMKKQNQKLSDTKKMREFFAYSHQLGDWREYARDVLKK